MSESFEKLSQIAPRYSHADLSANLKRKRQIDAPRRAFIEALELGADTCTFDYINDQGIETVQTVSVNPEPGLGKSWRVSDRITLPSIVGGSEANYKTFRFASMANLIFKW